MLDRIFWTILPLSGLVVAGCPAAEDASPFTDTGDQTTGAGTDDGAQTDTSTSTTGSGMTGADDTATGGGDPCDACDPVATCEAGVCACPDGYDGDGTTCSDVDECAGAHDCHADATCINIEGGYECDCNDGFVGDGVDCEAAESCADDPCDPNATCTDTQGGFECACDSGWSGNGFSCTDVDECTNGQAGCDANATCSNTQGSFDCTCDDPFEGDGFTCNGTLGYGETCMAADVCASQVCILDPYNHCSELCNQAIANNCPDVGAAGFCVPIGMGDYACVGDLQTGLDSDDAILSSGDAATRVLGTLTDADLFHLSLPAGSFVIMVDPDPDDDVQLEIYDSIGQAIGVLDDGGDGQIEGAVLDTGGGVSFAVVRNVGNSTGSYTISVAPE